MIETFRIGCRVLGYCMWSLERKEEDEESKVCLVERERSVVAVLLSSEWDDVKRLFDVFTILLWKLTMAECRVRKHLVVNSYDMNEKELFHKMY